MFAARLKKKYQVDVFKDLGFDVQNFVAVEANTTNVLTTLNLGKLTLSANGLYDFALLILPSAFQMVGRYWECKEKWVGISKARVQSITATDTGVTVAVRVHRTKL